MEPLPRSQALGGPAKAAALLLSLALGLGAAEGMLRAWFSLRLNYDIEMWRYAVALKQPVDDARSHVHLPSRSARLMDVEVAINSRGLRDRELPYEKPAGTYRIVNLGDSVAFGWGVPLEATYGKLLERRLGERGDGRRYEVLNLGVGNYNTEQEIAAFWAEGIRYAPDAVLLVFHMSDGEPAQRRPLNALTRTSYAYAFAAQRVSQLRPFFEPENHFVPYYRRLYEGESWIRYEASVREFARALRERDIRLIPVLLPELHDLADYPFEEVHRKLAAAFAAEGVEAIDLLPAFRGAQAKAFWVARDDVHPNASGHERIARGILQAIDERGLLR